MRLELLRKIEQSHEVGDRGTIQTDSLGDFLLCSAELDHEQLEAVRFLDGVQVLTLQVLNDAEDRRVLVRDLTYEDRDLAQAGELSCSPTPLPRDDLQTITHASDEDGLKDPTRSDGVGKRLE